MKKLITGTFIDLQKIKPKTNSYILLDKDNCHVLTERISATKNMNRCTKTVDLSHLYLIPAFIDSHVHLSLDGIDFNKSLNQWDKPGQLKTSLINRLKTTYNHGIGAVRDAGDKNFTGIQAKKIVSKNENKEFPLVIASGEGLRKSDHYGTFLGRGLKKVEEEGESTIKRLKEKGVNQVKIILNGVVSFNTFGKTGKQQFEEKEFFTLTNISKKLGLPVMAHVNSESGIKLALSAGVHSIEHGYFISEELLKEMALKNIYWIPTIAAVANQLTKRKNEYTKEQQKIITKTYKNHLKMVKKAVELGVKVGAGTDAGAVGVEHGKDYYKELLLLKEAGLDNKTILKAATCWNREILTIAPDKNIGLVGLRENPLINLETIKKPELIIK